MSTTTLEQRKKDFMSLYTVATDKTMFEAAVTSGLGIQDLAEELKTDREFYKQVKEICGLRIKKEVMDKHKEAHNE